MLKKKDKLLDIFKNQQKYPILSYLSIDDLISLSLVRKNYYLQILPEIKLRQLDDDDFNSKCKQFQTKRGGNDNKKGKNKNNINNTKDKKKQQKVSNGNNNNNGSNSSQDSEEVEQVGVQIQKYSIYKWPNTKVDPLTSANWNHITALPFHNRYLQKKLQSKCYIFYCNPKTNDLLYINRSFVDPSLDFQKGSFNGQMDEDLYQHMYQNQNGEELTEIDFSSRQILLKRHKQMLQKINAKKAIYETKGVIKFEKQLQSAANMKRYAMILCFGGSFSLGIFEHGKCLLHKSDKKYVCRKKAGERQFNKDKQSGSSIKSMGSQIRRDQQKKHLINVNEILNENKEDLEKCEIIFLQAPGMNRLFIINQNQTMAKLQQKLRSVCLTAKKANFTEVQAIHEAIIMGHLVKVAEADKEKGKQKGREKDKEVKVQKQKQKFEAKIAKQ